MNDIDTTPGWETNKFSRHLDPVFKEFNIFDYEFSHEIWSKKYRNKNKNGLMDQDIRDTFERVAEAMSSIEKAENRMQIREDFYDVMSSGMFIPAGRILAGAGTDKRVTLVNCFVNETLEDSMTGIMQGLEYTALTMQMGGGMGTDFSTLRPRGARLKRTQSPASGPLPFMDMWDSMCQTIMSAGDRRGAMMGTLSCTHPDLMEFITYKQQPGKLRMFNVSVLVSDAFMNAVQNDDDWDLYFHEPPHNDDGVMGSFFDDNGVEQFIYSKHKARDIWNALMKSTYEYAEPGVIFMERVNKENNLKLVETIACTNPCGEQPLPPHGACNLGAINLAMFVRNPFTSAATFNFELLKSVVRVAVRFLDNVIDVTQYPLHKQQQEQQAKRRTGLGIMGLADMLFMMNREYDSEHALQLVDNIMRFFANAAYEASADLAVEYGSSFPLYEQAAITTQPFYKRLSGKVQEKVAKGLRNGVLLTIAPTGTTAIIAGNVSGSGEPYFALEYFRKVLQADNSWKESAVTVFGLRLWRHIHKYPNATSDVRTSQELPVSAHVNMQAVLQKWIDASISKTVNCPSDISFEDFQAVYMDAYEQGCKGCTTYRPSDVRGSVLSTTSEDKKSEASEVILKLELDASMAVNALNSMLKPRERPKALGGQTYKLKWPLMHHSIYMTVNDDNDGAFEVFFNTRDTRINEWLVALSVTLTAMMRQGHDITFLLEDLESINSLTPAWLDGIQHKSLISYIANTIRSHIQSSIEIDDSETVLYAGGNADVIDDVPMTECSSCGEMSVVVQAGCKVCTNCGDSKCG